MKLVGLEVIKREKKVDHDYHSVSTRRLDERISHVDI